MGPGVELRADANRGWSLDEAIRFGRRLTTASKSDNGSVHHLADLAFIEEPTASPADWDAFTEATGVRVAADESLDDGSILRNILHAERTAVDDDAAHGQRRGVDSSSSEDDVHSAAAARASSRQTGKEALMALPRAGLAAIVVKPSVIGSFEAVERLSQWARTQPDRVRLIISSAFESSCGISALTHLAAAVSSGGPEESEVAHGLGTLRWFGSDVVAEPLPVISAGSNSSAFISTADSARVLASLASDTSQAPGTISPERFEVHTDSCLISGIRLPPSDQIQPAASGKKSNGSSNGNAHDAAQTFVFLHGFLGSCRDWVPLMRALHQAGHHTLSLDLPGHGGLGSGSNGISGGESGSESCSSPGCSVEAAADASAAALRSLGLPSRRTVLVGYSLGARVALALAARHKVLVASLVLISGSAGIEVRLAGAYGTSGVLESSHL